MAAQSKAWVCGHSIVGIVSLNPSGGHEYLSIVNVVFCQLESLRRAYHSPRGVLPCVVSAMIALAKPLKKRPCLRIGSKRHRKNKMLIADREIRFFFGGGGRGGIFE
jgi:hypothetical protein